MDKKKSIIFITIISAVLLFAFIFINNLKDNFLENGDNGKKQENEEQTNILKEDIESLILLIEKTKGIESLKYQVEIDDGFGKTAVATFWENKDNIRVDFSSTGRPETYLINRKDEVYYIHMPTDNTAVVAKKQQVRVVTENSFFEKVEKISESLESLLKIEDSGEELIVSIRYLDEGVETIYFNKENGLLTKIKRETDWLSSFVYFSNYDFVDIPAHVFKLPYNVNIVDDMLY